MLSVDKVALCLHDTLDVDIELSVSVCYNGPVQMDLYLSDLSFQRCLSIARVFDRFPPKNGLQKETTMIAV